MIFLANLEIFTHICIHNNGHEWFLSSFLNFLIGKQPNGPGQFIFGIVESKVKKTFFCLPPLLLTVAVSFSLSIYINPSLTHNNISPSLLAIYLGHCLIKRQTRMYVFSLFSFLSVSICLFFYLFLSHLLIFSFSIGCFNGHFVYSPLSLASFSFPF